MPLGPLKYLLAIFRFVALVLGGFVLVLGSMLYHRMTGSEAMLRLWRLFACKLFGIHVHVYGVPAGNRDENGINLPVLYVANHLSYLDIMAMGSVLDTVFVAKSDVRDWPVIGYLAQLQKTVFIRRVRTGMEQAIKDVRDRLNAGYDVVVYAEGTSSQGVSVLPFKPGLFELAYAHTAQPLVVQPVAVVLEKIDNKIPNTDDLRNQYAWWRPEDTLMPHLWNIATIWRTDVGLHFLPVLEPMSYDSRKDLAQAAHDAVAQVVQSV